MENKVYTPLEDGFFPLLQDFSALARQRPAIDRADVRRVLGKAFLDAEDFAVLLSPAAGEELEGMARRASEETLRHFGRARQFFAPLYLGNYCSNRCVYCGFNAGKTISRKALTMEEVEEEASALAATGLRCVLALTGDAPGRTGADYIAEAVSVLARHFSSVGIEVQALTEEEYASVAAAGANSMTMFQETYDPELYARLHLSGPKRNFTFRLDAPHRAVRGGMRGITLGALLGLGDWRFDIYMMAMHGQWLQQKFPDLELAFSLPRIRPRTEGEQSADAGTDKKGQHIFEPLLVDDRAFVQALTALRCFLPHVGITLSTRERAYLRDHLLPLGVTKISAGVCTGVGGYAKPEIKDKDVQFVIDDGRSVDEMAQALESLGYQPVFADWLLPGGGTLPLADGIRRSLGNEADLAGTV